MASSTAMALTLSPSVTCGGGIRARTPSASLTFLADSSRPRSLSLNVYHNSSASSCSSLLHSSFLCSSSSLSFPSSSFSGLPLGLDFQPNVGTTRRNGGRLVVRAGKAALCMTKRNKSRKSLARTHGFRRRMRTTSGRAILKRRRAKGRKVLCTKSNPNSGKRS
ncbi:hypothetical protein K1719_038990 [Acacia pycnantha]|nr:hypothetical protein K1719_038990 [Acacia pycnantha]